LAVYNISKVEDVLSGDIAIVKLILILASRLDLFLPAPMDRVYIYISPIKQQFVVTHTIRQTEIPASLDISITNTPVKMLCPQKIF
jgi:hypothetical protein